MRRAASASEHGQKWRASGSGAPAGSRRGSERAKPASRVRKTQSSGARSEREPEGMGLASASQRGWGTASNKRVLPG